MEPSISKSLRETRHMVLATLVLTEVITREQLQTLLSAEEEVPDSIDGIIDRIDLFNGRGSIES